MILTLQIIGLAISFAVLTYIYWRIWGRKLKNKAKLLSLLKSNYNTIFFTIMACNMVYLLVGIYTGLSSAGTFSVQMSFIVCLLLLIIPKTLISCLENNVDEEQEEAQEECE